jgi:hypothetical protein
MTTISVAKNLAESAAKKIMNGTLMRLGEVAAMLDVVPATVHALPLPSIRIGKSLRFDPRDVHRLIESGKELHCKQAR